ncbi:DUF5133 domain-containing protein [Streptomyces sp. G-G2]|uniref:DUF5133 domain-containing protein n=1 Tax=Streptomyces sp. G-G2 TaxID=3046201 RepID=UPI0024B8AACF|nr:DUF5133 domain-containing protein [Streptomyces sp. G-G2]MDJ0386198.1 DUF5133 domain-containing protein [Streptomyces sp. G-G2]
MTETPARRLPAAESAPRSEHPLPGPVGRAELERATGILMAFVPCDARTALDILDRAALAAGTNAGAMAQAAVALVTGRHRPAGAAQEALGRAIQQSRIAPEAAAPRMRPSLAVAGETLSRMGDLRRALLLAPTDPALRAQVDDAVYTLCVLMGRRTAHAAAKDAELLLATRPTGG